MWWCMRRRSRTICLSLAVVTVCFHLFLVLVSVYQQPCSPSSSSLPRIQRALERANYSSVGVGTLVKPPPDANHMEFANEVTKGHSKSATYKLAAKGFALKEAESVSLNISAPEGRHATYMPPGVSKLEALFSHPLYNMPTLPIPEDDWLLRVKPKVKPSEKSSQMWMSAGQDVYENVQWNSSSDSHPPWLRFHLGVSRWQLYPHRDSNMEALIQQLSTHRIVSSVQKSGGTQLKLVMSFPNYGQAMFKPMKQERDDESNYNLYYFSDFERHNAEIAAFHLDRVLGYRRIPPVVGRLVDVVKEIKDITTDPKLARTFFTSPVGNVCFYGQCSYYCSTEHAVCGRPRALEASLAVMLPDLTLATRRSWRSPWRRSYSRSKLAKSSDVILLEVPIELSPNL